MQTSDLKKVQLPNGETYAYFEFGNSPNTILFLHGSYLSRFMAEFLGKHLSNDFHIIAPNLRGDGQSTYNKSFNDLDALAEDVKLFVDALGLNKFYLMGWSMGGMVSMKFAANYPDHVEKLILHNSGGAKGFPVFKADEQRLLTSERVKTDQEVIEGYFVKELRQIRQKGDREAIKAIYEKSLFGGRQKAKPEELESVVDEFFMSLRGEDIFLGLNKYNITNESNGVTEGTNQISKIRCPVLILHGEKDLVVPPENAEELKRLLKDKAELRMFKEAGHEVFVDYPEEFISAVKGFFSS